MGHYELYISPSGELRFYSPSIADLGSGLKVDNDTCRHVAITYDGNSMKFYGDGDLIKSIVASGQVVAQAENLRIGGLADGTLFFRGQLDDIVIYNRALTEAEILSLAAFQDLESDTWVATDALGRTLPGQTESGLPKYDKIAAVFHLIFHERGHDGPYNITNILAADPIHPNWGPRYARHYWGEPENGYYLAEDAYVIRKQISMWNDAGIDVVVLDATNGWIYLPELSKMCRVMMDIRKHGGRTPQFLFMTNTNSVDTVKDLYDQFYSKNLYPELWFIWKGKPLVLAALTGHSPEVQNFFTIRYSWSRTVGYHRWPLYADYPQGYGWDINSDKVEAVSVSVSANPIDNIGRSFRNGVQPPCNEYGLTGTEKYGYSFNEQWNRGLKLDPDFMFITTWNCWTAPRFISPDDGNPPFMGKTLSAGDTFFVDNYTQEYSHDIEPMKDGHTDNYY